MSARSRASPAFASRLGLSDRWREWLGGPKSDHPIRPRACASLKLANWRQIFERSDAGISRFPVEVRHPYMDVRMVRYILAVPPIPWCANKHLLRESMRDVLPEAIRRRPKTPLAGDPVSEHLKRSPEWWRQQRGFAPEIAEYVVEDVFWRSVYDGCDKVGTFWANLRPLALNYWLRNNLQKEKGDETRIAGTY